MPLGTVMWPGNEAPPQDTLRGRALAAIKTVQWVPAAGENRITGMIENRPDWVVSRQRAWGVPIAVFVKRGTNDVLKDERVNAAIAAAFEGEGADAWFAPDAAARFLGAARPRRRRLREGRRHPRRLVRFGLDARLHARGARGPHGAPPHRRRARHGHVSRGLGPASRLVPFLAPRELRHARPRALRRRPDARLRPRREAARRCRSRRATWSRRRTSSRTPAPTSCACGWPRPTMPTTCASAPRSSRPSSRPTASCATRSAGCSARCTISATTTASRPSGMPELERFILHRLAELDGDIREAYAAFDYKRVVALLNGFMTTDLSAFYFDIRKDALYCDPISSLRRKSALTVIDRTFRCVVDLDRADPRLHGRGGVAVALSRRGRLGASRDLSRGAGRPGGTTALAERWARVRRVRRVVTGALEIERAQKRIGSSLEAAPDGLHRRRRARRRPRRRRLRRDLHHFGHRRPARRGAGRRLPARRGEGRQRRAGARRGPQMRPLVEDLAPGRQPIPDYPDVTPRDADARSAREHGDGAPRGRGSGRRPAPRSGAAASPGALATLVLDQASKLYLLFGYDLPVREPVVLAPFLELIVVWNRGISYGLFQQDSELGRWLLLAVVVGAAFGLSVWMARARPAARRFPRPDRRGRRRQRHRPGRLRRGVRLRPFPRRLVLLVRLQHGRRRHRCGRGRAPL